LGWCESDSATSLWGYREQLLRLAIAEASDGLKFGPQAFRTWFMFPW
jgi:hypothetical protein